MDELAITARHGRHIEAMTIHTIHRLSMATEPPSQLKT
jgi:hypothetical protein